MMISEESKTLDCPNCKLTNPAAAQRCDCGYDFTTERVERSYLRSKDPTRFALRARLVGIEFGLVLAPIWLLFDPFAYLISRQNPAWGSYNWPPFARAIDAILFAAIVYLCFLFVEQKKSFPLACIVVASCGLAYAAISTVAGYLKWAPDIFGTSPFYFVQLQMALSWGCYLQLARRVRATHLHVVSSE